MPLPIERSQGNVASLVSRFQIAANRDATAAARDPRDRRSIGGSVRRISTQLESPITSESSSLPSSPPATADNTAARQLPAQVSSPKKEAESVDATALSLALKAEQPAEPVKLKQVEVSKVDVSPAPQVETAPAPPKAGTKSTPGREVKEVKGKEDLPIAPATTEMKATPKSQEPSKPDPTRAGRALRPKVSTPKLKAAQSTPTRKTPTSRPSSTQPLPAQRTGGSSSGSPIKPTASSLAKTRTPVATSPTGARQRPRASIGQGRSPPLPRPRASLSSQSIVSPQSTGSSPASRQSSASRLMQGTAASRARAAATQAEHTPTRTRTSIGSRGSPSPLKASPKSSPKPVAGRPKKDEEQRRVSAPVVPSPLNCRVGLAAAREAPTEDEIAGDAQ